MLDPSNLFNKINYMKDFYSVVEERHYAGLDLEVADVGECLIPVLKNGSNNFQALSSKKLAFDKTKFLKCGIEPQIYIIVPEISSILGNRVISCNWDSSRALVNLFKYQSGVLETAFWVHGLHYKLNNNHLRYFDSHLCLDGYQKIASDVMSFLEILPRKFPKVITELRDYRCDLATRFSEKSSQNLFPAETFLKGEFLHGNNKRGLHRVYRNPSAPIDAKLLIIGDSHSYSALAQIFSFYFEETNFYWASRVDGFGELEGELCGAAEHADFVIEESAERFFLKNFCEPRDVKS